MLGRFQINSQECTASPPISISKYLVSIARRAHTEMQSVVSVVTAKDSQELASKNKKNFGVEWWRDRGRLHCWTTQ